MGDTSNKYFYKYIYNEYMFHWKKHISFSASGSKSNVFKILSKGTKVLAP